MGLILFLTTLTTAAAKWIEALVTIFALGRARSWGTALAGSAGIAVLLLAILGGLNWALTTLLPLSWFTGVIGILLLLSGLNWLFKAVLQLGNSPTITSPHVSHESFCKIFACGSEVVFLTTLVSLSHNFFPSFAGVLTSLLVVAILGLILGRPIKKGFELGLKYVGGIALSALGTIYTGEGVGVTWWHGELSFIPLVIVYTLISGIMILWLQNKRKEAPPAHGQES